MTTMTSDNLKNSPPVEDNYLTHTHGIKSWLFTLDHKRIGVMYLCGIMGSMFLGGLLAMLIRAELFAEGQTILPAIGDKTWQDTYNQVFTLHGAIMVFLFIIPGIPASLGNFMLPVMLGAKDVAFPKLNLASWWLYMFGAVFSVYAIVAGGLDTGWTFYTPYSTAQIQGSEVYYAMKGVIPITAGAFILGFSSILTGLNFIATIHMLRPKGMGWFQMPLFLWGLYATAIIQLLATPVLAITLLLLLLERAGLIVVFDPAKGGDPVLYQHFFWFYSHPAVYIMILPAMGIISEVISTHSRKHIFGYKFIAYSSVAIALSGFLVWGHHMYTSGQSAIASAIFSVMTFFVAIPSAIKMFNWLATMYKGSISLRAPMLYALSFMWVFAIGGLTGLFLGSLSTNIHLHDTYFIVAHFHYVMVGGTVFAFLGGLHHWWPKMFGKRYSEKGAFIGWLLIFVGFNVTFFIQFVLGTRGMPRRYADWTVEKLVSLGVDPDMLSHIGTMHKISSIGAFIQGIGFMVFAAVLIHAVVRGRKAAANPWGGASLEWTCASPPPYNNFEKTPTAKDPYDFTGIEYDPAIDGYVQK